MRGLSFGKIAACLAALAVVASRGVCLADGAKAGGDAAPAVQSSGRGGVSAEVTVRPGIVSLAEDLQVSIMLRSPAGVEATLPAEISDRFEGFSVEGRFDREPYEDGDGMSCRETVLKIRPIPAAERYRIAPMAVTFKNAVVAGSEGWFPTKPIVLESRSLLADGEKPADGIEEDLRLARVGPSGREILRWALRALAALACIGIAALLARLIRRRVKLMRMSPRERALMELDTLIRRRLPEKGRAKQFYVELTAIVRRYIERRHGIRAPEQTTEEFLREAASHPAFRAGTLDRLRAFLDSADLVKFAGVDADELMASGASSSAREYIVTDSAAGAAPESGGRATK